MNAVKEVGGTINEQHSYNRLSFSQKRKVRKLLKGRGLDPLLRKVGNRIGYEDLIKVIQLGMEVGSDNERLTANFIFKSPDLIDRIGYEGLNRIALQAKKIAGLKEDATTGFILVSPDLIDRIGCDGLDKIAELEYNIAMYDSACYLSYKSLKIIDKLLEQGGKGIAMNVLALGNELAKHSGQAAVDLISKSLDLIDRIGYEGLEKIAGLVCALAMYDTNAARHLVFNSPDLIDKIGYEGFVKVAKDREEVAKFKIKVKEEITKPKIEKTDKSYRNKFAIFEEEFPKKKVVRLKGGVLEWNNAMAYILNDTDITTGSRQLIATRYLNEKINGSSRNRALYKANRLYSEVKNLERILEGTPTFGCELFFERKDTIKRNSRYNLSDGLMMANAFLKLAGKSLERPTYLTSLGYHFHGKGNIRPCEVLYDKAEFRINPSYAPITIALVKEMFELGIFPSDVIVTYAVNIVGKDVLNHSLPLILTNYVTGLTPYSECGDSRGDVNALHFRDIHIYSGATVDPKTGILMDGIRQLNIIAGVTGKIDCNKKLIPYKEILEKDVDVRLSRMLAPFLANKEQRSKWGDDILKCFSISDESLKQLHSRLKHAIHERRTWNCGENIRMVDPAIQMLEVSRVYQELEEKIACGNPGLYFQISNAKL